jgi:hypothetical protein
VPNSCTTAASSSSSSFVHPRSWPCVETGSAGLDKEASQAMWPRICDQPQLWPQQQLAAGSVVIPVGSMVPNTQLEPFRPQQLLAQSWQSGHDQAENPHL